MYRIFIVEDDEIIANLLKKNLCSWDMMSPAQKIFPISYRNLLTEIRSLSCWI